MPTTTAPTTTAQAVIGLERALAVARSRDDPAAYQRLLDDAAVVAASAPDAVRPRQIRAVALLALGRARDAAPVVGALVADHPDVVSFGLAADTALATGDVAAAAIALERMMDIAPGLPVYARVADLRFRTGDVDGSLEMWRTAFQAGHKSEPEALAFTAVGAGDVFLFGKGDLDQAARSYDAALLAMPRDPAALIGRARVRLARGEACDVEGIEDAARDADVVAVEAACAPVDDAAFVAAVEAVAVVDRRAAALALATRDVAHARAHALAIEQADDAGGLDDDDAVAFALLRAGDVNGALPRARRALSSGTADVRVLARMGLVLARADDVADATDGRALLARVRTAPGLEPHLRDDIRAALAP